MTSVMPPSYIHGLFFALIDDDTLYLKVDDLTRAEFERIGGDACRLSYVFCTILPT